MERARQLSFSRLLLAILLTLPLSCSDFPTRPLRVVEVTGLIQDRDGAPLQFFLVLFSNVESRSLSGHSRPDPRLSGASLTGADGTYSMELYEGVYEVRVYPVAGSGYAYRTVLSAKIAPDRARFDYRYSGVRIHGRVYGPGGSTLPGAQAHANLHDAYAESYDAVDRGQGFSMLVDPGRYDFRVGPLGADGVPTIRVENLEVRADTTLEFHLDGFPVTGTIRGPDSEALQGVSVQAYGTDASCSSLTGADGAYRMYLPQGGYSWEVVPEGSLSYIAYRRFPSTQIAGPAQFDFSLDGIRWSGTVRVLPDSTPGRGYRVVAVPESYGSVGSAATFTDSTGAFRLVVPTGMRYEMGIESPPQGYPLWVFRDIPAGGDSTLDFLLDPAAAEHRTVVSAGALTRSRPAAPRPGDRLRLPRPPAAR